MKIKKQAYNYDNYNFFDIICTFFIFFTMIILLLNPKKFANGTIDGIKLFFFSVLPGLLPFMILTKLLTEIGFVVKVCSKFNKFTYKIFGTSGLGLYAFFMSILSGYPIGAKIISDLYLKNLITDKEAQKMSVFCTTSGPVFVIGAVGTMMFGSYKIGLILYFSHIISSLFLGIINTLFSQKKNPVYYKNCNFIVSRQKNVVNICINDTINSLFIVCAYITIFYLLGEILSYIKVFDYMFIVSSPVLKIMKINSKYLLGIFYGILEVTRGVKTLSMFCDTSSIIIATGLISLSGISIIFQSLAFLKNAKIKMYKFVLSKIIHSILSMMLCFIFCIIFL